MSALTTNFLAVPRREALAGSRGRTQLRAELSCCLVFAAQIMKGPMPTCTVPCLVLGLSKVTSTAGAATILVFPSHARFLI